jgi:hypothetical protein
MQTRQVQFKDKTDTEMEDRMIITAASSLYGPSLLALLGSLNLNWPGHPRVRVYDIGLGDETLRILDNHGIEVVKVPEFCPHWQKHFTWKIWCWNDAPASKILWMDAGIVALRPLDEVFLSIDSIGYFVVPTYHPLLENASESACKGCGVDAGFRDGKVTLAGGFIGFKKEGKIQQILNEALSISLTEEYIAATERMHRHDQAIISLLFYRELGNVLMSDGVIYCSCYPLNDSPKSPGQAVWVHRRSILPEDRSYFASRIVKTGPPYVPKDPNESGQFKILWKKVFGGPERFIRRLIKGQIGREGPYDGVRNK